MARPRGKLAHSHDGVLTSDLGLIYSRLSAFIRGRLWTFDLRRWTFSNLAFVIYHLSFVTLDFRPSTLDIRPSPFEYLFPLIKGGAGGCPNWCGSAFIRGRLWNFDLS